jgi:hypothetical protein
VVEVFVPFCDWSGVLVVLLCEGCEDMLPVLLVLCEGCDVALPVVVVLCDGAVAAGFCVVVVVVVVWSWAKAETETISASTVTVNTTQSFLQSIGFSLFSWACTYKNTAPEIEIWLSDAGSKIP